MYLGEGNPAAGTGDDQPEKMVVPKVTAGDRFGAAVVTILMLLGIVGGGLWI